MADSGLISSGGVYGVWCRCTVTSQTNTETTSTINWSSYWYARWQIAGWQMYWSSGRIFDGVGTDHYSSGWWSASGGNTSNQDTLLGSRSDSFTAPRRAAAYNAQVYTYMSTSFGSAQPIETRSIPAMDFPVGATNLHGSGSGMATHVLTWTASADGRTAGYRIYVTKDSVAETTITTTALTYTFTDRAPNSTYTYTVVAYNVRGEAPLKPNISLFGLFTQGVFFWNGVPVSQAYIVEPNGTVTPVTPMVILAAP